jgi:hypothetical protein
VRVGGGGPDNKESYQGQMESGEVREKIPWWRL